MVHDAHLQIYKSGMQHYETENMSTGIYLRLSCYITNFTSIVYFKEHMGKEWTL
jgi:hypothetical protein